MWLSMRARVINATGNSTAQEWYWMLQVVQGAPEQAYWYREETI